MGLQSKVVQLIKSPTEGTLGAGSHRIAADRALAPTDAQVITPLRPPTWETVRSKDVNGTPQYYTAQEAETLTTEANQKQQGAKHTKKAYRALSRIEYADAQVHLAHRTYLGDVAAGELAKKTADGKLAGKLHSMRPQFAKLGYGVQRAEAQANARIAQLKTKYTEALS